MKVVQNGVATHMMFAMESSLPTEHTLMLAQRLSLTSLAAGALQQAKTSQQHAPLMAAPPQLIPTPELKPPIKVVQPRRVPARVARVDSQWVPRLNNQQHKLQVLLSLCNYYPPC